MSESFIEIMERRVIPSWEGSGLDRLAVTRTTLQQFRKQPVPEQMRTTMKKRIGKKTSPQRKRYFNNAGSFFALWPEDGQAIFRFPTLAYIVEGQADFHVADYMIHCPQGHFLLFSSGVPRPLGDRCHFAGEILPDRHCSVLWFFNPPGTNSITAYVCYSHGDKHWTDTGPCYHIVHRQETIHLFKTFIQEMEEAPLHHRKIGAASFQAFLYMFTRELQESRYQQARKNSTAKPPADPMSQIQEAQEYVRSHLNQPLSAARVAQKVYMSRSSFIQQFARETGQTFHAFVIDQRIEEAKRLLSTGYWPTLLLCQFVGLKPTQLRAQFKQRFGVTPAQYYQALQTKEQNR